MSVMSRSKKTHVNREPTKHHDLLESFTHTKLGFNQPKTVGFHHFTQKSMRKSSKIHIFPYIYIYKIYCPAFMIVEKVVLYICIFGHHGYSTNIHYWSELGTLRTS